MPGDYQLVELRNGLRTLYSPATVKKCTPASARWLERAARSDSVAPLPTPTFHRAKLTLEAMSVLLAHRQFTGKNWVNLD